MRWRFPKYFPGWFVSGGGGGGGAATVQTDGVTIQGDGSGGNKIRILAVQADASLRGNGNATPLGAVRVGYFSYLNNSGAGITVTANKLVLFGILVPYAVTFSHIVQYINTGDGVNNSDIGIYNFAGTLVANIGAQIIAAGAPLVATLVQGTVVLEPGLYMYAFTSAASTLNCFSGTGVNYPWAYNATFGTSASGALPASITTPAIAPTFNNPVPWFALY